MTITYLIVRHGEAEGNREHRFIGQTDVPLSELGVAQANAVSAALADRGVTAIISSDLRRASDTVTPLSEQTGIPIKLEPDLREIANGEWKGLLPEEVAERWSEMWQRYRSGEDLARPGGERWQDVADRAVRAIETDTEGRTDGDVVVVGTHGGPTLALVKWITGHSISGGLFGGPYGPVSNGSITTIELPSMLLIGLNDVRHLGKLGRRTESPFKRA